MSSMHASDPSPPRDVDLEKTRRTFLFAREQVSCHAPAKGYSPTRDSRHRAAQGERGAYPVTHRPDASAR